MKKTLLLAMLGVSAALTSCNPGEADTTSTGSLAAYNLVSNLDNGDTYVTVNSYQFAFNWTKGFGSVSTENLIINNTNWKLTTTDTDLYTYGGMWLMMPQGTFQGNSTLPLKNDSFVIAPVVYYGGTGVYFNDTYVPGYPDKPVVAEVLVAKYNIGDEYLVRTFFPDMCFYGETVSSYPSAGGEKTFTNKEISYRLILDIEKNKADMIVYNAKFSDSEREPVKTAILAQGLDLEFNENGYTITGENIVPSTVEGNQTTPNESFVFNSINIETVSESLSTVNIKCVVAGIYKGDFTGSYFSEPKLPGE